MTDQPQGNADLLAEIDRLNLALLEANKTIDEANERHERVMGIVPMISNRVAAGLRERPSDSKALVQATDMLAVALEVLQREHGEPEWRVRVESLR